MFLPGRVVYMYDHVWLLLYIIYVALVLQGYYLRFVIVSGVSKEPAGSSHATGAGYE